MRDNVRDFPALTQSSTGDTEEFGARYFVTVRLRHLDDVLAGEVLHPGYFSDRSGKIFPRHPETELCSPSIEAFLFIQRTVDA